MPLLETKGAASAQGFGGAGAGASGPVTYIEDVFSTWLYTGNGSTQTITNGIDLSTKGGMVWIKQRSSPAEDWRCVDSARGINYGLQQNLTNAQQDWTGLGYVTSFNTNGFSIGTNVSINTSAYNYASWTFRKAAKFFDVVTYTGDGANRTISHNLGSVPGCIIVKRTDAAADWQVYHRSLANTQYLVLNSTAAVATGTTRWNSTTPTSTVFSLGTDTTVNANGGTYVAYLFAHNAGGFGLTGTDNVISCGSFTGNTTVNLGYEPQWLLIKNYAGIDSWTIMDNMRGMPNPGNSVALLRPNTSGAEGVGQGAFPTATGFTTTGYSGLACIYIAIRRGPMKVPTSGTSVFNSIARAGTSAAAAITGVGFAPDVALTMMRTSGLGPGDYSKWFFDRLRGNGAFINTANTNAEAVDSATLTSFDMNGVSLGTSIPNRTSETYINPFFRRAPGFFDVVCYTGTGSATTFNHNLGVAPELVIVKWRSGATGEDWAVMCTAASSSPDRRFLYLDLNAAGGGLNGKFADSSGTPVLPTATQVYIGTNPVVNNSAATYVAYLFATCAGVSKVGTYTGNGSSQTINCGFTGGARFVLIKRTDSTGDWYVWDTTRGIVAGNDPHLSLNSTAAEVTTNDSIDTDSTGFIVNQLAATNINVSSATYIYLAIA